MVFHNHMRAGRMAFRIAVGIKDKTFILVSWLTNSARKFLYLLIVLPLIVTLGCLEPKLDNISQQPTPSQLKPSTEFFPNEKQIIDYMIIEKSIQANDIRILNYAKIEKIDSIYATEKPYFTGDYVAVRMLIKNYTVITMEFKDSDHLFVEVNYSAISKKEKEVFNILIKYKLDSFYFGSGQLTPTRITFVNATHAEFRFVSDWNDFHKYWIESYGTIDTINNSIWIKLPPKP